MNKTNIGWCTHTWNPAVGCLNGCPWCYARRMAHRGLTKCSLCTTFVPHLHPERLVTPGLVSKRPRVVFVGSMCDLWSAGMKQEWRDKMFRVMCLHRQHQYVLLTKRPGNITMQDELYLQDAGIWVGTSITCGADMHRLSDLKQRALDRSIVSIEPLLGPIPTSFITHRPRWISWVIVGGLTGPGAIAPSLQWIKAIRDACLNNRIPLWEKENLPTCSVLLENKRIQQAPDPIADILFREENK